jgi:hypothetical protein
MKKLLYTLPGLVSLAPAFVYAQDLGRGISNVQRLIEQIGEIIDMLIPIVFALALLTFFWGLVRFIFAAGGEEAKETGKRLMIGGLIALFVMSAVWGIVRLLAETVGVETGGTADIPDVL